MLKVLNELRLGIQFEHIQFFFIRRLSYEKQSLYYPREYHGLSGVQLLLILYLNIKTKIKLLDHTCLYFNFRQEKSNTD